MSAKAWRSVLAVCLLGWASCARAESLENPLGIAGEEAKTGALILCGGGSLREEIYEEFIRLAGGQDAHIVHIPWAYPFSTLSAARYRYYGWTQYDVASFSFLNVDTRQEADVDEFIKPLEKATGVWIGGGTQARLASLYGGTKVEAALKKVLARGGVIGGTSAGASILSETMIRSGTSTQAVTDRGFSLVSRAVIDQHFSQRNRLERLLGVLEEHQDHVGIGIDENTAVILQQNRVKVVGSSRATFCLPGSRGDSVTLHRLRDGEEALLVPVESAADGKIAFELRRRGAK